MAISDTLQDISQALNNAKDAVVAKGGTIGDTGLSGLASEIASIPGGGSVPIGDYGQITFYTKFSLPQIDMMADGCSAEIVDENKFVEAYLSDGGGISSLEFSCEWSSEQSKWNVRVSRTQPEEIYATTEELLSIYGISVTDFDPTSSFAMIQIMSIEGGLAMSDEKTLPLDTVSEFNSLCAPDGVSEEYTFVIKENQIYNTAVGRIIIGQQVTTIPNRWSYNFVHLYKLQTDLAINVVTIGNRVLTNTYDLYQDFIITSPIEQIGDYFLESSSVHSCGIHITTAQGINTSIGNYFAQYSGMTNSTLRISGEGEGVNQITVGDYYCRQTNIGVFSFQGNSIASVGNYALNNCKYLQTVDLYLSTAKPQSIGTDFCYGCPILLRVTGRGDCASKMQASSGTFSGGSYSYKVGISISGDETFITTMKTKFPDSDSRKWAS